MSAVYLQHFPSYSYHSCKKIVIFTYPDLHFLFALGTPLWQSRKTLHEWKDNLPLKLRRVCFLFCAVVCVCAVSRLSTFYTDRCRLLTPADVPVVWGCPLRCVRRLNFVHCVRCVKIIINTNACVACVITETAVRCSRRWVLRLFDSFIIMIL